MRAERPRRSPRRARADRATCPRSPRRPARSRSARPSRTRRTAACGCRGPCAASATSASCSTLRRSVENGRSSPRSRGWSRRYRRNRRSALRSSSPSAFTNSGLPSAPAAKYGVEPRASTPACSSGERQADAGQPGGDEASVGRRDGCPQRPPGSAAPANQPMRAASTESNDTGEARKRVTTRPMIKRPAGPAPVAGSSHGAAAVSTPATIADAVGRRELAAAEGPQPGADVDERRSFVVRPDGFERAR